MNNKDALKTAKETWQDSNLDWSRLGSITFNNGVLMLMPFNNNEHTTPIYIYNRKDLLSLKNYIDLLLQQHNDLKKEGDV
jgi:hypothetical protein